MHHEDVVVETYDLIATPAACGSPGTLPIGALSSVLTRLRTDSKPADVVCIRGLHCGELAARARDALSARYCVFTDAQVGGSQAQKRTCVLFASWVVLVLMPTLLLTVAYSVLITSADPPAFSHNVAALLQGLVATLLLLELTYLWRRWPRVVRMRRAGSGTLLLLRRKTVWRSQIHTSEMRNQTPGCEGQLCPLRVVYGEVEMIDGLRFTVVVCDLTSRNLSACWGQCLEVAQITSDVSRSIVCCTTCDDFSTAPSTHPLRRLVDICDDAASILARGFKPRPEAPAIASGSVRYSRAMLGSVYPRLFTRPLYQDTPA